MKVSCLLKWTLKGTIRLLQVHLETRIDIMNFWISKNIKIIFCKQVLQKKSYTFVGEGWWVWKRPQSAAHSHWSRGQWTPNFPKGNGLSSPPLLHTHMLLGVLCMDKNKYYIHYSSCLSLYYSMIACLFSKWKSKIHVNKPQNLR